ncbi:MULTISPECIES: virulence-related protein [Paenibacillus]|uniref:Virulence-related protein n=1 Tax=Paenibacillus turicensis TaxID=160487 RepID=A0ABS4FQX1_9BACL|nr:MULTISPECIES: virulence-related protein [Paenibacillus]MBP1904960.1 hypothetical protein [Paenibacillus turicensis]
MDRKEIIKTLGDHFGVKPKYMGVPSFIYQIETDTEIYSIDRAGKITNSNGMEVDLDSVLTGQVAAIQDEPREPNDQVEPVIQVESGDPVELTASSNSPLEVAVPLEGHTGVSLRNLVNLLYSKQVLVKRSLSIETNIIEDNFAKAINDANVDTLESFKTAISEIGEQYCPGIAFSFDSSMVIFKFFQAERSPEEMHAYTHLVGLLNQTAMKLKYTSPKGKDTDNDKFTFRLFLIRLGMVGDKYKTTRKILLANLDGHSAFRGGKKPERV